MKKEYLLGSLIITIITAGALGLGFWFFNNQNVGPEYTLIKSATAVPQEQKGIMFSPLGKLEPVELNKIISADETIHLGDVGKIYGLSIDAKINLISDNSLIRIVLVSGENEYLVYEGYPAIINKGLIIVNNFCEETCALDGIKLDSLKVQTEDASINLRSINFINSYNELDSEIKSSGVASFNKEIKEKQDKFKIKKINEKKMSWIAGETTVSKLSYQEKKRLFSDYVSKNGRLPNLQGFEYYAGGIFELKTDGSGAVAESSEELTGAGSLPSGWDWRNRHGVNWVTPVRYQGSCGSCWAFGATGATETMVNLYFNQHINMNLAEQDVLSCSGGGSCSGGYHSTAASYIKTTGVVNEDCFPYSASDLPCENKCDNPTEKVKIGGITANFYSSQGEDALKEMIINGAVSGRVDSWWHVMHLVGYDTVKVGDRIYGASKTTVKTIQAGDSLIGQTYWTFKNSWGAGWGESGYARINLPLSEFNYSFGVLGPVTTMGNYEIACVDNDSDGYCNWGISENKPSLCPSSCKAEKDCDDSDPDLAGFDANYNCINTSVCYETDEGKNYDVAGQVVGVMDEGENFDYCIDDKNLRETFCNGIIGISEIHTCSDICRDGACVTKTCEDSDRGIIYDVKGEITGYMADSSSPNYDYCIEGGDLYEVFCLDGLGYNKLYTCPGMCQDGKCIEITPPTIAITYPVDGKTVTDKFLYITTNVSDNTQKVDFYIDGSFKSSDTSFPFSYKMNTRPYDTKTIIIKAIATADNESTINDVVTVTIGGESNPDPDIVECNDGKDNDGDGTCDWNGIPYKNKIFPGMDPDTDCVDQYDTSESGSE